MQKDKNYYEILGLPKYAPIEDIKGKYKSAVKYLHPDANVGKPKAEVERKREKFEEIQRIYEELSDADAKKRYDLKLMIETKGGVKSKYLDNSWGGGFGKF